MNRWCPPLGGVTVYQAKKRGLNSARHVTDSWGQMAERARVGVRFRRVVNPPNPSNPSCHTNPLPHQPIPILAPPPILCIPRRPHSSPSPLPHFLQAWPNGWAWGRRRRRDPNKGTGYYASRVLCLTHRHRFDTYCYGSPVIMCIMKIDIIHDHAWHTKAISLGRDLIQDIQVDEFAKHRHR